MERLIERLTEKHYLGTDHYMKCSGNCNVDMDCIDCPSFDRLVESLAAYEDTGLTPENVEALKLSAMGKAIAEITEFDGLPIDRLLELAEADKDGRLVVMPCKVDDKLYRVFDGNISEHEVQNMKYFARQRRLGIDMTPFFPDAGRFIGKTVFLSREEAEKALEAMKDE
nr:MAG TPA: hypothetical protein [Caudoviricetes sp.]